jgi:putative endonuclease
MSGAWVYILKCADGSYYTGLTRNELPETREQQHNQGMDPADYTFTKRPVKLVYAEFFELMVEAIAAERQIKGWSRAKKEALALGNWKGLQNLSKRRGAKHNQ